LQGRLAQVKLFEEESQRFRQYAELKIISIDSSVEDFLEKVDVLWPVSSVHGLGEHNLVSSCFRVASYEAIPYEVAYDSAKVVSCATWNAGATGRGD
jgi:hypothetical protein